MSVDKRKEWRPCPQHPDYQIAPYYVRCSLCEIESYHAVAEKKRESRIEEAVEIVRRCMPLIVAAMREYDKEQRG